MIKTYEMLIIEDHEPDFFMFQKAVKEKKDININLINIKDGQDGLNYIFKKDNYKNVKTPDMIVLDLNLPTRNGFEILDIVRKSGDYKTIPVIIYSSSEDQRDVFTAYSLYANSYIVKTFDIKDLFRKINFFIDYWFYTVELPDNSQICLIKEKRENNENFDN